MGTGWSWNWNIIVISVYTKRKGITGEKFICIYSWTMEKKKLIHPVESGTEIRRFPSFPRTGNERERNRITGGDDRGKIVVHENIARLTVNDVAWNSEWWWMTLTERRPSTTKKAKKAQRPERNFERRKRADFSHFSIRKSVDRVESREMRRIVRIQLVECNTWHTHLRVASEKRWIYYAPERRSLDSVPPDLTRIPCSTLFDRCGSTRMDNG